MVPRTIIVVLLLCVAIAKPFVSEAGECQAVVVFFESKKDILNIVNLDPEPGNRTLFVLVFRNDGLLVRDFTIPSIGQFARLTTSGEAMFDLARQTGAPIEAFYMTVRMGGPSVPPWRPFSATVTQRGMTRELGCITP
jgi:hypothetical protein